MSGDSRDVALAMRDHGRSWSEVAERVGLSVPEVKALVEPVRVERRRTMAHSIPSETRLGLLDPCLHCPHVRRQHDDSGECIECGPRRTEYRVMIGGVWRSERITEMPATDPPGVWLKDWDYLAVQLGCEEFESRDEHEARRQAAPSRSRYPNDLGGEAHRLGVLRSFYDRRQPAQGVRLRTVVRRARRKAARRNANG